MFRQQPRTRPKRGLKSRLSTLLISALFLFVLPCVAAIGFDTVTDGGNNGGTTNSLSWSHTATGSNILLTVCLAGDNVNTGHDDITSVTSGGSGLTLAAKYTGGGASSNNGFAYIYFLASAPSGAHTIVVNSTNNHYLIAVSATYTGTSALQPDNTATFPNSGSNPFTTSITTFRNNAWVVTCENAPKSGPSTTCVFRLQGAAFNLPSIYDTNAPVSPAGSSSCTTEANIIIANDNHVMMSIIPFGAPTSIHHKVSGN